MQADFSFLVGAYLTPLAKRYPGDERLTAASKVLLDKSRSFEDRVENVLALCLPMLYCSAVEDIQQRHIGLEILCVVHYFTNNMYRSIAYSEFVNKVQEKICVEVLGFPPLPQ